MSVDLGVWDWLRKLIVVLLVAAAVVGVVIWYLPEIKNHESLLLRLQEEKADHRLLVAESEQWDAMIVSLERPETIERLAREYLDMARDNELVLNFQDAATNPAPNRTP